VSIFELLAPDFGAKFIFNAFINLEPVQRSEDEGDMRRFRT